MRQLDRRRRILAALLALLAGYVDAVGFIASGGFFLSFMSGNSTRLGVGLFAGPSGTALLAGALMASFVSGVALASLLTGGEGLARQRRVLLLVATLLAVAAFGYGALGASALLLVSAAMGASNTAFEQTGDVRFGITYMTGTLVRLGLRLAALLRGEDRSGWLPLALHWLTLVAGAVLGAALWPRLGVSALWPAAALAAGLALAPWQPRDPAR